MLHQKKVGGTKNATAVVAELDAAARPHSGHGGHTPERGGKRKLKADGGKPKALPHAAKDQDKEEGESVKVALDPGPGFEADLKETKASDDGSHDSVSHQQTAPTAESKEQPIDAARLQARFTERRHLDAVAEAGARKVMQDEINKLKEQVRGMEEERQRWLGDLRVENWTLMQVLQHARTTKETLYNEVEAFEKERDTLLALHMDKLESEFDASLQRTPLGEALADDSGTDEAAASAGELHDKLCAQAVHIRAAHRNVIQRVLRDITEIEESFLYGHDFAQQMEALKALTAASRKVLEPEAAEEASRPPESKEVLEAQAVVFMMSGKLEMAERRVAELESVLKDKDVELAEARRVNAQLAANLEHIQTNLLAASPPPTETRDLTELSPDLQAQPEPGTEWSRLPEVWRDAAAKVRDEHLRSLVAQHLLTRDFNAAAQDVLVATLAFEMETKFAEGLLVFSDSPFLQKQLAAATDRNVDETTVISDVASKLLQASRMTMMVKTMLEMFATYLRGRAPSAVLVPSVDANSQPSSTAAASQALISGRSLDERPSEDAMAARVASARREGSVLLGDDSTSTLPKADERSQSSTAASPTSRQVTVAGVESFTPATTTCSSQAYRAVPTQRAGVKTHLITVPTGAAATRSLPASRLSPTKHADDFEDDAFDAEEVHRRSYSPAWIPSLTAPMPIQEDSMRLEPWTLSSALPQRVASKTVDEAPHTREEDEEEEDW